MWATLLATGCIVATSSPTPQRHIGREITTTTDGYATYPQLFGYNHLAFAEEYFKQWTFANNKKYNSTEEKARRFQIFKDNMLHRNMGNSPNHQEFYGINRYSDLTHEEYKALLATTTTEDPELQRYTEDLVSQLGLPRNASQQLPSLPEVPSMQLANGQVGQGTDPMQVIHQLQGYIQKHGWNISDWDV